MNRKEEEEAEDQDSLDQKKKTTSRCNATTTKNSFFFPPSKKVSFVVPIFSFLRGDVIYPSSIRTVEKEEEETGENWY